MTHAKLQQLLPHHQVTMGKHMTPKEQDLAVRVAHEQKKNKKKYAVTAAFKAINAVRKRVGVEPLKRDAVYRYLCGDTHKRSAGESRGRKATLANTDVKKLLSVRRRLIKKVNNEQRITYQDIIEEAGYDGVCSEKTVADALRAAGLRYTPPRKKICLSTKDAAERLQVAKIWEKRPASYWVKKVHGFYDCKTFPMPLTDKQRVRFRQTRVTGHLRFPAEGTGRGFTKPRSDHCWLGVPSVTIAAVVAKDRVIMWHDVGKKWNGAVAAGVYSGPMLKALRRTWGPRRQFTIVEDGDRKGNQSNKGKNAKKQAKLRATVLPPRSPCFMPLDYSIWKKIVDKVVTTMPKGKRRETKEAFSARLKKAARSLPRGFVAKSIGHMKKQVL